jgi:spore cortex formation protein SpoVR/YcgB (stage V sporulation)
MSDVKIANRTPLFAEADWDFETLDRAYAAIREIAEGDLGLDIYPNQIEIISSEQMLDAYSSHAMPLMYRHWSFGKIFARQETLYRKGYTALAYEIVINSSPCISYLMEENTMTMQALVIAHAAFGHNHFFKNNYLFRQWTDAGSILDYLNFAKKYISACEERYGLEAVELTLDSAHAIMDQGVFRFRRPPRPSAAAVEERRRQRIEYDEQTFSDIWRTLPIREDGNTGRDEDAMEPEPGDIALPEENLLYFLEKKSPILKTWQREILRIVRNISQYFYPQKQTKVMNEGCATFVHHYIMNALYDKGLITEGSMLEFMHSHTSVVFQPGFDDPRYSGINPYALGFAMMADIKRICTEPTAEDKEWFPDIAGCGDWRRVLRHAWANFRDESFILQYLSPKVIRDLRLFALHDTEAAPHYTVSAIHDEDGYRRVRETLSRQYDLAQLEPDIQVVSADLAGDRMLVLAHKVHRGVPLSDSAREQVFKHIQRLWGHDVRMETIAAE